MRGVRARRSSKLANSWGGYVEKTPLMECDAILFDLDGVLMRWVNLPIPRTLVTGDDVRQGKPAPEPYLVAAKRMGVAVARCVVVEDAPAGVEAAHAAGMPVIAMTTTHSRDELPARGLVIDRLSTLHIAVREGGGRRLVIQIG
jgi:beta-phosphoglucomutase-like phosphatase (HAD superfamily)